MDEVYNYLTKALGLKYKDTVVVGVSGGPDSMALLHIINQVKKELDLFVIVAHVNHNVRKESDGEKEFLKKYCDSLGLYFDYMKIENYGEDNFHNEARTIRYNYFDKVCLNYGATYLFTAHHADDLMETILMRIVRGSTLKGYSGFARCIERENYKIVRPLITLTKEEILQYDKENNIPYVTDKSNEKDVYTRNRYRKYILPFLKNEDPKVHTKFLKFSETLIEYNDYIQKEINQVMTKVFKEGILDIEKFLKLEHLVQSKIIYNILEQIYGDDLLIVSDVHVNLLFKLIKSEKANSIVHFPNNVKAIKSYNELTFSFNDSVNDKYEVEICDVVNLPNGMNIDQVEKCDWTNNFVIRLNSKDVTLPLHVRSRQNGDKIEVKGMLGRKKVNDIFIEDKIATKDRNIWPIVCDSENRIVWIPGLKKSKFDKDKDQVYDIILRYY